MIVTQQNCMTEWHFSSGPAYPDPFNDVDLDVVVTDPDGEERRVPAFWSGESTWRVRYASPKLGTHSVALRMLRHVERRPPRQRGRGQGRAVQGPQPAHAPRALSG